MYNDFNIVCFFGQENAPFHQGNPRFHAGNTVRIHVRSVQPQLSRSRNFLNVLRTSHRYNLLALLKTCYKTVKCRKTTAHCTYSTRTGSKPGHGVSVQYFYRTDDHNDVSAVHVILCA